MWGPQPPPWLPDAGLWARAASLPAGPPHLAAAAGVGGRAFAAGRPHWQGPLVPGCGEAALRRLPAARRPPPPWLHRPSPSAALSPPVSPSSLTSFCRLSESLVLSSVRPLCGPRGSFCTSFRSFWHLSGSLSPLSWDWSWLPWAPVELLGPWGGIPGRGDPEPQAWGRALACSVPGWRLGWVCWLPTAPEAPCCIHVAHPHPPESLGPSGT